MIALLIVIDILRKLIADSDWAKWLDFVSPEFFDVVPTWGMLGETKSLIASAADRKKLLMLRDDLLAAPQFVKRDDLDAGRFALRIYFHQIMNSESAALDIRASAFSRRANTNGEESRVEWQPAPLTVQWKPDFLDGLRGLYSGFYGNDRAVFQKSLDKLGLGPAEPELRRHFGTGDQTDVAFRLSAFRQSFHDVFVACKKHRLTLNAQFLPLGCYLACLYSHLEQIGGTFDVRAEFLAVMKPSDSSPSPSSTKRKKST